jgi:hypothetical protein
MTIVTGKHKELLVELLIHHLANRYYNGNHEKVDMTGDYWVKQFIDTPNAYWWSGDEVWLDGKLMGILNESHR